MRAIPCSDNQIDVTKTDPRIHFIISEEGCDANGVSRAYLTWIADDDGKYPKIEELNLKQLNLEIVKVVDGSLGHGWVYYLKK